MVSLRIRSKFGVFLAVVALAPSASEARDCRVNLLPNGNKFSCSNCHLSAGGGGSRNPFGQAVFALVTPGSCAAFWSSALASADSDGDGRTNGTELGDPTGAWRPGMPNPGVAAEVTNPGVVNRKFIRADANADGQVDVSDAVRILEFLFRAGPVFACRSAADSNNSGAIDLSDPVHILLHLFSEQPVNPQPP